MCDSRQHPSVHVYENHLILPVLRYGANCLRKYISSSGISNVLIFIANMHHQECSNKIFKQISSDSLQLPPDIHAVMMSNIRFSSTSVLACGRESPDSAGPPLRRKRPPQMHSKIWDFQCFDLYCEYTSSRVLRYFFK